MEIILRPIPHSPVEREMGHCTFYPPINTDAISCTFNMDGFSPMKAVLRAHGLEELRFERARRFYEGKSCLTLTHGEPFPNIITSARTATWNEIPDLALRILMNVEDHFCKSLCMTHFGFILGRFPEEAFIGCMRAVNFSWSFSLLQKVVVDVDARFFHHAMDVWQHQIKSQHYFN